MKDKIPGGAALVAQEAQNRVEAQDRRWRLSIPVSFDLAKAGDPLAQVTDLLKMSTEGDFSCLFITCKIVGYNDAGEPVAPATFGGTGVKIKIDESGWGRELMRDFVALEDIATPGYGEVIYQPFPFEQIFLRSSEISFDVRNVSNVRQRVELTFHGWQYRGTFRAQV